MRVFLASTILAASLASAPMAFAADHATGEVQSFNLTAHSLALKDGMTFQLPKNFKDPGLKIGEKVKVSYDMKAGKNEANAVTIVR